MANFALEAQDKLKILVVDGDPQTSLVQSETFFLIRALNPAGERDSSLFLPSVIVTDGLNAANLDAYQVVVLCNVATLPDAFVAKLQNYLRQGGGLLIFAGDRFQADHYNQKLAQVLPRRCATKKPAPNPPVRRSTNSISLIRRCKYLPTPFSRTRSNQRGSGVTRARGGKPLISLANGDPLLLEQKSAREKPC